MADRPEIDNVLATWALGYDDRSPALMERCFTEDATMTLHIGDETMGPYVGRSEVMKHFTDHHEVQTDQRRHVVTNLTIEAEDDTSARTTSVLTLLVVEDDTARVQATGVYRDHFVLDGDRWRIRERVLRLDAHY
jgi:SnoaL-like domain